MAYHKRNQFGIVDHNYEKFKKYIKIIAGISIFSFFFKFMLTDKVQQQQQQVVLPQHYSQGVGFGVKLCDASQTNFQREMYSASKLRGCPPSDDSWALLINVFFPKADVFVDIGCNKGYSAARFFSIWYPESEITPKALHSTIVATSSESQMKECGACGDCREDTEALVNLKDRVCSESAGYTSNKFMQKELHDKTRQLCDGLSKHVQIFSFDGNKVLVEELGKIASKMTTKPGYSWYVEQAAFTDKYTPGDYTSFVSDGEMGHISDKKIVSPEDQVKLLSIDNFMQREGLEYIDILKVDTEGFDYPVIMGGAKAIEAGLVNVIMFEYNGVWNEKYQLKNLVDYLWQHKYVCYFEGKNLLMRITSCWNDKFDNKVWSNVICVNSNNRNGFALVNAFDNFSIAFLNSNN